MKKISFKGYWVLLMCCLTLAGYAQIRPDSAAIYRLETSDGNEYTGVIVSQDTASVVLQTDNLGSLKFNQIGNQLVRYFDASRYKEEPPYQVALLFITYNGF